MHYLNRVTTLQRDTGAKKFVVLIELVILQPQRRIKRTKIVGYNVKRSET
jgi:hypothetical protein